MAEPFLGQVILFGGNFPPYGWATCNGAILPIQQYSALFSLLGTYYGGNGTTNFALPDLQGRAPICYGAGPGLSIYDIGEEGGLESVGLTDAQSASHSHVPNAAQGGTTEVAVGNFWAGDATGTTNIYGSGAANTTMNVRSVGPSGLGQSHENRPPYLALNYIIALQGQFPQRP